jgi:hypothetical protein
VDLEVALEVVSRRHAGQTGAQDLNRGCAHRGLTLQHARCARTSRGMSCMGKAASTQRAAQQRVGRRQLHRLRAEARG